MCTAGGSGLSTSGSKSQAGKSPEKFTFCRVSFLPEAMRMMFICKVQAEGNFNTINGNPAHLLGMLALVAT